ncbi:MAG: hypothetical protein MMC23_004366 [Stictis urceolatum]|nr:hypothetical protein [Stictis urceolata]
MALSSPPVLLPSSPTSEPHIYTSSPHPSIEHDFSDTGEHSVSGRASSGPDEAVFDHTIDDDARSSPGTSHASDDDISELPSDSRVPSRTLTEREDSIVYTPKKQRSPFRNPSSVRALQLDTTPPHLRSGSGRRQYRMGGMGSRSGTPRSAKSFHSAVRSPRSPTKSVKTEFPLVLLHVTLLPALCPYSQEVMEAVLPEAVIENWKLLREKISDTVLERGILIPHPKEDYDVLEERLLESLELKVPRILKCGHFHLSPEEEEDILASETEDEEDQDLDICEDCGRRIRNGLYGTGSGQRRWDIKIYASNGLMRAGAWNAAWREMERVDVEILPWIEDGMRRELDLRKEEELAHMHAQAQSQPPPTQTPPSPPNRMDEERRREIYGDDAQAFVDGFADPPKPPRAPEATPQHQPEPPFTDLLANYFQLLLQDRRNVVIAVLGVIVLFFALGLGRPIPPIPALVPDINPIISQVPISSESAQVSPVPTAESRSLPQVPVPEAKLKVHAEVYQEAASAVPDFEATSQYSQSPPTISSEPELEVEETKPQEAALEVGSHYDPDEEVSSETASWMVDEIAA